MERSKLNHDAVKKVITIPNGINSHKGFKLTLRYILYKSVLVCLHFQICVSGHKPTSVTLQTKHRSLLRRLTLCLSADYLQIIQTLLHVRPHWRYLLRTHTPTHTHDSNNFPPPAACCGSWSAASVNWLSAEEEEEKEEGAAGHEQQRRWRPIGNQCTKSISAPYGQNTRSDSCHSPHRTLRGRMLSGQHLHCQESNSVHFSLISSIRLPEIDIHSLKERTRYTLSSGSHSLCIFWQTVCALHYSRPTCTLETCLTPITVNVMYIFSF